MKEFISLGDEAPSACASEPQPQGHHGPVPVATTPKDAIIHLHQNQVHMDAPPQTQTLPQDNVTSTTKASTSTSSAVDINAASCVLPVAIPKQGPTESAAEPSVRLVYSNLTRESKRKLMQLMQQWSECQARIRTQPNSSSTVEDMDLSDDSVVLVTKHGVSAEMGKGSGPEAALVLASRTSSAFIDQSPTRGGKRAPTPTESTEPSVSVVCNNLTRESKRELMELMQQWSEWQATKQPNSTESAEQVLDCAEETYYPALHVGSERPCVVVCTDNHSGWIITKHEKMLPWMWVMMVRCPCTIENLHWVQLLWLWVIHQMLRARKKMRRMIGAVSTVLRLVMLSRTARSLTTMLQLALLASMSS